MTLRAELLYEASLERRRESAYLSAARHWVLAIYAGGLAVETLLQAFAIRQGARFDARHDLAVWLSKCPLSLQSAIYLRARPEWNRLTVIWSNRLRYLSVDGLRVHLRERGLHRVKPRQADPLKTNCDAFLHAVGEVYGKGLVLWPPSDSSRS